jgi:L-seryl-tRNA(Ser) seleniumtransferase
VFVHPPSVDALARSLADVELPPPLLVDAAREAIAAGDPDSARARAEDIQRALLRRVVNATGVLLHTNLGRAPLEVHQAAAFTNLELDLATGRRGSRHAHVGRLLARLCGAEAAMVVNNNAAAVLLVVAAVAGGRDVLVSRGESVEIGGGFRVPEIVAQSGARLVDVGTTNRTRRADYEQARAGADVALVLKVHPSNFRLQGFTADVSVGELARLGVPVVHDLGSGLLDAACPWLAAGPPAWLRDEPAARQSLAAGATAVTFSGDKLLGGPQAGVIAGSANVVAACAAHPLARALRPGALVLGALQDVALAYLLRDGDAIPFWRLATLPVEELEARAHRLGAGTVVACESLPGAGSLPGVAIPSAGVAVDGDLTGRLRAADPPVIARVADGRTVCDLRAVDPADDAHLAAVLRACSTWPS